MDNKKTKQLYYMSPVCHTLMGTTREMLICYSENWYVNCSHNNISSLEVYNKDGNDSRP